MVHSKQNQVPLSLNQIVTVFLVDCLLDAIAIVTPIL